MDSKEQRIKVAIVINDFLVGGAQKLIVDMLRHADHQKFHYTLVTLFSFSDRKDFYQNLPKGIQLHRLSWKGFRDFRSWRKFYRVLKTIRPDVVISHLFFANTVSRILKIFLGYKVISFEHNTYTGKSRFQIWTDRLLAHLTFRIVAVSQSVKEFTAQQENIPLEKFKVILNGIDLTQISDVIGSCEKNELRKALNLPQEDTIIINVARLTAQKNQPALIEGFARFLKERPHYTLIILGEGSLKSRLEQRIKELGLSGKILLLGVRENIYHYYCASDFFISPSFIEGFGIAHA
ncbi:MAG: glycosyltransferase, partial [Candidatus Harrisonbacteria bacterium]|nr:glycosyltransferase [Candidatus Harrisonbacteria bacterium]